MFYKYSHALCMNERGDLFYSQMKVVAGKNRKRLCGLRIDGPMFILMTGGGKCD